MKIVSQAAAITLGLIFFVFGLDHFLHFMPQPPQPAMPQNATAYFGVMMGTPYLTFVKICEVLGGALMLIPATRNVAMLLLGPVIVNIWCFHIFIAQGVVLKTPMAAGIMAVITLDALIVLFSGRKAWAALLKA